jgi:hypothetical protein
MAKHDKAQTQQVTQTSAKTPDPQQLIAQKAYELWEQGGRIEGRDLENWLEAERLIRQARSSKTQ